MANINWSLLKKVILFYKKIQNIAYLIEVPIIRKHLLQAGIEPMNIDLNLKVSALPREADTDFSFFIVFRWTKGYSR